MVRTCVSMFVVGVMGVCLVTVRGNMPFHSRMVVIPEAQCMDLRAGQCVSQKCIDSGICSGNSVVCSNYTSSGQSVCELKIRIDNIDGHLDYRCRDVDGYTGCGTYNVQVCREEYACQWTNLFGSVFCGAPVNPDDTDEGDTECDDADGGHTS